MDSPGEILSLCRLCLVKDQVNIPIFEEQGDIRQIFLKISSCLPVTITRHDQLPKRICDACSNKLDLLYEFWNSSASAEKTLLSWLGQAGVEDAGEKISAVAQQIAKPAETLVKEESEALDESNLINESRDSFDDQSLDEGTKDEAEAPPPKRARRTAAVKAQINITPESDEDEDDEFDAAEAMTKMEDESEESESELKDDPSYSELPGTSADDDQAGPSGVGKDGVEAPLDNRAYIQVKEEITIDEHDLSQDQNVYFMTEDRHKSRSKHTYCCKICSKPYRNLRRLNLHLVIHSENRPYSCEFCPSRFKTKGHLVLHRKRHKAPQPQHACKICRKQFRYSSRLRVHLLSHSDARPYACEFCSATYKTAYPLKVHRNTHTKQIHFNCTICNKSFLAKENLKLHQVIHSDNYTFDCQFCGKSFKTKPSLQRHRNLHTREKLFNCDICNTAFACQITAKKHFASHFKE